MQQTIDINGNIGDEVCLKYGEATLIVKIGDGEIIPDFAAAATKALTSDPYEALASLNNVYHHNRGANEQFAQTMAFYRDRAFDVKVAEKQEEATEEKKSTSRKKKAE